MYKIVWGRFSMAPTRLRRVEKHCCKQCHSLAQGLFSQVVKLLLIFVKTQTSRNKTLINKELPSVCIMMMTRLFFP
jgi:hypothetical protein